MQTSFDAWLIKRLAAHGAYRAAQDSTHGRGVIAALKEFQRKLSLPVTGTATAVTVAALRRDPRSGGNSAVAGEAPKIPAEPVWMREARRHMGLKEIAGPKSSATIMSWAKRFGGWIVSFYTNDDIPWCGLAVGHWIAVTLPEEQLPSNPLGALNWSKFGRGLTEPALGAILTFKRPGGGHVGLYAGEDGTHYHVLGGNQSNSVSVTRIEKTRCQAIRWPTTGGEPIGGPVRLSASGVPASKNEA
ncbi:TIGR02594 family protein [Ensifer sp. LCM 4579]|uniref:TIGR02594 family protein n=1 Tax=Ensifer sp. LCM 4579 TaxID=1848292 RepID=UPI0008DA086B|nr:TIGR02594 family protein [Ensifer sp. LCM 4579]OHV85818.1 hypothetical protein LCM4579_00155 [Ensifer sp. LCM 4579]